MSQLCFCLRCAVPGTSQAKKLHVCMVTIFAPSTNDVRSIRGFRRAWLPAHKAALRDQNAIKEFEHRAFLDKLESRSLRRPSSFHTKTSSKLTTSCSRKSN